jgi:LuxR family maltose regulon positive regulatory protein
VPDPAQSLSARLLAAFAGYGTAPDRYAVVTEVREIWREPWPAHLQPQLVMSSHVLEQRLALTVGSPGWTAEVADRAAALLGDVPDVALLRAVSQIRRGQHGAARELLRPLLDAHADVLTPLSTVEAWLWEARLAERAGEDRRAADAVAHAVAVAAPLELVRPLVHGGQEVADLLSRAAGSYGHDDVFVERARSATRASHAVESSTLTPRERELLGELPSMRTAEEIAESMLVSVNTVKTHIRGIYRKLGVTNRRDAVVTARLRGLL